MSTQNKAVTCYLPPDIEQYLINYCTQYGIVRKDGSPIIGSGMVEILRAFFSMENVPSPLPSSLPSPLLDKELLKDLIKELLPDALPSTVPVFDDVVSPSQLDYRAATIISRFDDAIANLKADLDNRIKVVETEIGTLQQQKPKTTTRRQAKTTDNTLQFES